MNKISSADRSVLLRLASLLPVGDRDRRAILAGLQKTSSRKWVLDRDSGYWSLLEGGKEIGGVGNDNGMYHAYLGTVNENGEPEGSEEPIDSSRSLKSMKALVEDSVDGFVDESD